MSALIPAVLVAFCVWLIAVIGTAMLRHASERRSWTYQTRFPPSAIEPASAVWLFQLLRALVSWRLWPLGFRYALELLIGIDAIEELSELEVEQAVRDAEEALRIESERMLQALAEEQAEEFELLRQELEAEDARADTGTSLEE